MRSAALSPILASSRRGSPWAGVVVSLAAVAAATALVYPLKSLAPVVSLGVVYVPAVVAVSMFWGIGLGVLTALLSASAFGFFHLPPVGRFALADGRDWTALCAFVTVAVATGLLADLARQRTNEADERRREADLAADLTRLLAAPSLEEALPAAGRRVAQAIGVERAEIVLAEVAPGSDSVALDLDRGGGSIGTLLLPASISEAEVTRVRERVVPVLASVLEAAKRGAELQAEVVETAALRRSDEIKTAVLRSVSHDLRTPVTAILTAAAGLDTESPTRANAFEVRELVIEAASRLSVLIEKLLDLSRLQGGGLERRLEECSLEEVLHEAVEDTGRRDAFRMSVDPELPPVRADAAQLQRAFANVLENSARFAGGEPVSVRARWVRDRVRVRIVDRGPGIAPADLDRVFLPFYRTDDQAGGHLGSGLGLAIAKGFVEANGGRISIESVPAQGTSFVIEFPAGGEAPPPAAPAVPGAAAR
jgi:two-component system sensor histidine kinase KdpD